MSTPPEFKASALRDVVQRTRPGLEKYLADATLVSDEIKTLENYLRKNAPGLATTIDVPGGTLAWKRMHKSFRVAIRANNKGDFVPIVDETLTTQLEYFQHLPSLIKAVADTAAQRLTEMKHLFELDK
jgi:hypothetical protein